MDRLSPHAIALLFWLAMPCARAQPNAQVSERFAPGIVCTDSLEFNAAFAPSGNAFYFTRSVRKITRLFVTHRSGNGWLPPVAVDTGAPGWSDADPAFAPTGELYFISNRPARPQDTTRDYNIWKMMPLAGGGWTEPAAVGALNTDQDEFYISFTRTGDVYFASSRAGGYGEEDIYVSEYSNGAFTEPHNLGSRINTEHSEYDPFITAGGAGLIFTSSGRKDSAGKGDLYWAVRDTEGWRTAMHFGANINTPSRDFCPYIPADARHFFYSSEGDVKYVPSGGLPVELKMVLGK